jgi:thioredoxin reductase/Fe-S-cluster-containing hydrogenase component 2
MLKQLKNYTQWLHGQWPDGKPDKLPVLNADGTTSLPGTYVVGDLTGVPLLKFSADTGAKAIQNILADSHFTKRSIESDRVDVVVIGGGVSGYAAAIEAKNNHLNFIMLEASQAFSTIVNFPKAKPIFTYPTQMQPAGELKFDGDVSVKESLLAGLLKKAQDADIQPIIANATHIKRDGKGLRVMLEDGASLKAHKVVVAIGRSGKFRQLKVEGEEKALNRLHDPKIYADKNVLVVGGGDSAIESALAVSEAGGNVTLSYRKADFTRPKQQNIEKLEQAEATGQVTVLRQSRVKKIAGDSVEIFTPDNKEISIQNDAVLSMLGREAPLDFFRRSGMPISGESSAMGWVYFAMFMVFAIALYDWKNFGFLNSVWGATDFPNAMPSLLSGINAWWQTQVEDRTTLIGTIAVSMKSRSFYYTILYTSCIGIFGWRRIQRRKTPYVTVQTTSLFLIQLIPLFLLPEVFLPWMGYLGMFDAGMGKSFADSLFPAYISAQELANHQWPEWGHPRAFWHAYGFILAWPLNVYNVFTPTPIIGWLIISAIQTFVLIPLLVWKFGKGSYCGWICSCGALAETMGDTQRHKMPHGAFWNKLNMLGQVILIAAFALLIVRIAGWIWTDSWMHTSFDLLLKGENSEYKLVNPFSWKWTVDVLIGGVLGVGLYFKFSGRTWCRFACPLAALMHIYARFSKFRIFSDKSKCISCNVCTSVCHQGIDVMNFANKGKPMEDPQCVRCSACVSSCPTGTLTFGEINRKTGDVIKTDSLPASPVQMSEVIFQVKA